MYALLTLADKVLIGMLIAAIVAGFAYTEHLAPKGTEAVVQVDAKTVYKTDLVEARTFTVAGARGFMVLEVLDGKIAVTRADCPNQICVNTGWRGQAGDVIVCVPNKAVVKIHAEESREIRAVTG
jgi:hypothetical protein